MSIRNACRVCRCTLCSCTYAEYVKIYIYICMYMKAYRVCCCTLCSCTHAEYVKIYIYMCIHEQLTLGTKKEKIHIHTHLCLWSLSAGYCTVCAFGCQPVLYTLVPSLPCGCLRLPNPSCKGRDFAKCAHWRGIGNSASRGSLLVPILPPLSFIVL